MTTIARKDDLAAEALGTLSDELPEAMGAEVLTCYPAAHHTLVCYVILWDKGDRECSRCFQELGAPGCPVVTDGSDGRLLPWSQTHGCGEWNSVAFEDVEVEFDEDPADLRERILAAATELADRMPDREESGEEKSGEEN